MNSKVRCSVCRNYFKREEMLRVGLGLGGGICSTECEQGFREKYRSKRERRKVHREKRYGRRIPGNVRDRVRRRDHYRCRFCGTGDDLNLHHVRYRSEGGPDVAKNLITLCFEHHKLVHTNKRLYQPALLLWLWLFYEQGYEKSLRNCLKAVEQDEHPTWVEKARSYSDAILAASKPEKEQLFRED